MSTVPVQKALVVDDEPLARDELVFLLRQCPQVQVVAQAEDARSALEAANIHAPDIVFVDLRMPGPDGIALAQALAEQRPGAAVVVVSAHDDGALRAFEAQVRDYLLKPLRLERLKQTLERLQPPSSTRSDNAATAPVLERLAIRKKGSYVVLDIAAVIYFEVKDELVWAVTADDRLAVDLSLAAIETQIEAGVFFRSHRGFLVRLAAIRGIEPCGGGTFALRLDHPASPRVPLARERARVLRTLIPFAG
ncbi:MAG: LytR/AlgR family response regulator transcription factor [Polyangiales bacterium]